MRIFGKVCGWVLAAILALQAIQIFGGASLSGPTFAAELIALAIIVAEDAIFDFKKPKHPYLRINFRRDDGTTDEFVVRLDRTVTFEGPLQKPVRTLDIVYFQSDKDEATNEHTN